MRELIREGTTWRVHEVDSTHVPGARADRCLIYESDGIVRRVWKYPDDWSALTDDLLWALLDIVPDPTPSPAPAGPSSASVPATELDRTAISQRTRSLLDEMRILREVSSSLREERRMLLRQCHDARCNMREAVVTYAAHMRHEGVPPERVLVLLKQAVQEGISGDLADEPIAEELMQDGTRWCIDAYYAA